MLNKITSLIHKCDNVIRGGDTVIVCRFRKSFKYKVDSVIHGAYGVRARIKEIDQEFPVKSLKKVKPNPFSAIKKFFSKPTIINHK